ncbi:MAG: hypothetical protein ABEJ77_00800 [Halanaeroarchaeum sp.]
MSNPFLAGLGFRTRTPAFEPGERIECMVTGETEDGFVARIGDTVLEIEGAPEDAVDSRIVARVTGFAPERHRGTAEYRETVGESSF